MKCYKCNNFVHDLAVICPYCKTDLPVENRNIPSSFVVDRYPQQTVKPNSVNAPEPYNACSMNQGNGVSEVIQQSVNPEVERGLFVNQAPPNQYSVSPEQYYQNYYQNAVNSFNKAREVIDVPKESLEALCAIFPLMGLILYLVNQEKKPNCAKKYGKVALWGLAISGIIYVVSFILTFLFMFLGMYGLATGFNV